MNTSSMSSSQTLRPRPLGPLMQAALIGAVRCHEIYVIFVLLGLYALGAVVVRLMGIESAASARFMTSLGLQLGSLLTALLVILFGGRQMPLEMEMRTIYPILAKPVTRGALLAGKGLPVWGAAALSLAVFIVLTRAISPSLPYQSGAVLAQAFVLKLLGLAILTALTLWLSLGSAPAVGMLVTGAVYFGGGLLGNVVIDHFHGAVWSRAMTGLWPNFALLDQFGRYVEGGAPLSALAMTGLVVYGLSWTALFAFLARHKFQGMAL